jgi:hypothetical protein
VGHSLRDAHAWQLSGLYTGSPPVTALLTCRSNATPGSKQPHLQVTWMVYKQGGHIRQGGTSLSGGSFLQGCSLRLVCVCRQADGVARALLLNVLVVMNIHFTIQQWLQGLA